MGDVYEAICAGCGRETTIDLGSLLHRDELRDLAKAPDPTDLDLLLLRHETVEMDLRGLPESVCETCRASLDRTHRPPGPIAGTLAEKVLDWHEAWLTALLEKADAGDASPDFPPEVARLESEILKALGSFAVSVYAPETTGSEGSPFLIVYDLSGYLGFREADHLGLIESRAVPAHAYVPDGSPLLRVVEPPGDHLG